MDHGTTPDTSADGDVEKGIKALRCSPALLSKRCGVHIGVESYWEAQSTAERPRQVSVAQPGFGVEVMKPKEAELGRGSSGPKEAIPKALSPERYASKKATARAMVSDGVVVANCVQCAYVVRPCADGADTLGATSLQASIEGSTTGCMGHTRHKSSYCPALCPDPLPAGQSPDVYSWLSSPAQVMLAQRQ